MVQFLYFNSVIFHTGIRPEEILQIKIEMISLDNREIILPPEITKTGIYRIVPINDFLFKDLENLQLLIILEFIIYLAQDEGQIEIEA